ncbi:MAG TPA: hypothetical protein VFM79_06475 [Pelobium sp.]|nr:hypothetical protein [Pelobium sp.]
MNRIFISKTVLKWIFILLFPLSGWANVLPSAKTVVIDSTATPQKNNKESSKADQQEKQKPNTPAPAKPGVKKVPKARKQARPKVIIKPNIKVKPKIIRPNVRKP